LSPSRAVAKMRVVLVVKESARADATFSKQGCLLDVVGEVLVLRIARNQDSIAVDDRGGDVAAAENVGKETLDPGQVQRSDDDERGRAIRRPFRERRGQDRAVECPAHEQSAQCELSGGDGLFEKGAIADFYAHHVGLARAKDMAGGRGDRERLDHVASPVEVQHQASATLRIDVALRLSERRGAHHRARQRQHLAVHLGAVLRQIARRRLGHSDTIGTADLQAADTLEPIGAIAMMTRTSMRARMVRVGLRSDIGVQSGRRVRRGSNLRESP
jgi:hypothetical protein